MRTLSVFLVLVLGFLLLLKFYPRTDVVRGAESGNAALDDADGSQPEQGRFLTRPERSFAPTRSTSEPEVIPQSPPPGSDQGLPDDGPGPSWLGEVELVDGSLAETQMAALLVHGSADEVIRLLDTQADLVDANTGAAVAAFAEALAGRRDRAVERLKQVDFEALGASRESSLQRALGAGGRVGPPLGTLRNALDLALSMSLRAREASLFLKQGDHARAARLYSELLLSELDAPWEVGEGVMQVWSRGLMRAQERHRWNPAGSWPHVSAQVESGDSLSTIRKRYVDVNPGRLICTGLIARANGITGYIHPGDTLRIPTDPVSVRVDLSARWVLYFHGDEVVGAWRVGVGRAGEETITGTFVVGAKEEEPMWFPKGRPPVPFGDPANPLGTRWIGWQRDGRDTAYGFHGTKEPGSIGQAASDGCIRFLDAAVEALFDILPRNAPILVRP